MELLCVAVGINYCSCVFFVFVDVLMVCMLLLRSGLVIIRVCCVFVRVSWCMFVVVVWMWLICCVLSLCSACVVVLCAMVILHVLCVCCVV